MRLPDGEDYEHDVEGYLDATIAYGSHYSIAHSPDDRGCVWAYCIRVRCHSVSIPLEKMPGCRYACAIRSGDDACLLVVDTEEECTAMRVLFKVLERDAHMVLAALNMYDRAEKAEAS